MSEKQHNTSGPRKVTREEIVNRIAHVDYIRPEFLPKQNDPLSKRCQTLTICIITLDNHFSVRGESACVNPADFSKSVGESLAYEDAFNKLWQFFGFLSMERFYRVSDPDINAARRQAIDQERTRIRDLIETCQRNTVSLLQPATEEEIMPYFERVTRMVLSTLAKLRDGVLPLRVEKAVDGGSTGAQQNTQGTTGKVSGAAIAPDPLTGLALLRTDLVNHRIAGDDVANDARDTMDTTEKWRDQAHELRARVTSFIGAHWGQAEAELFNTVGNLERSDRSPLYDVLVRDLDWLGNFIICRTRCHGASGRAKQ